MPKVNKEYFNKKRDEILDAAYKVVMEKPIYTRQPVKTSPARLPPSSRGRSALHRGGFPRIEN